ncbi:Asparagine-rich protein (ARP protein), partial [Friedmanniomyces endolithicus]
MATPTSGQPYQGSGGAFAQQATQPQAPFSSERAGQGAQGQYVPSTSPPQFDKYCIIHVATTCDEHGVYVTKDSAEVIEIGWVVVDAKDPSLPELHHQSVLVRPVNTPITPLCTSLTTLTWEHVRNAGDFRAAILAFDAYAKDNLTAKDANPGDAPTFAFVTLMPWDLRVQLAREARDKSVVLPAYLQHPILFGLRGEYQTFQSHHPETLAFSASNLSSICAGLEVEEVRSSGKVTGGLPFHLQALAPSSPRRALEEALTLTRCLRSLLQKSRPSPTNPSGTPGVLTRPLDARSDVRAFLGERSKVIHLTGLPHDTTQSELESWFTQFGGRPIAFWTIRTPEGGKPSGSGFVVFGSHEEAAESLSMNGRALNDRAIEVEPSSARVLDRAAGSQPPGGPPLLTPFPPSKNRPRPGDWTCPSCGFSNFQRRTACFRCSFAGPDPYGGAAGYGMSQNPYGGQAYGGQGYGGPPGGMRGGGHMHGGGGEYGGQGGGMGGMGGSSGRGGIIPFRAGDWRCGNVSCGYHNFAKNVSCLRYGESRSNAIMIVEGGGGNNYPGGGAGGYGGPQGPPSMQMGSMDSSSYGGMPQGGSGYGGGAGMSGGYGGQSFGPQSTYALPSSLGAPSPYMQGAGYAQMGSNGAMQGQGGFDSRAEQAFNQGNASAGGAGGYSNGAYGQ